MKMIILGGGSLGFIVADYMSREGHDVTVIEPDAGKVKELQDRLDIEVLMAHGDDLKSLQSVGIADSDIFLALSDDDNANMIACSMAKFAGARRRIARVSTSFLLSTDNTIALKSIGVDEVIDSEENVIHEIEKMVDFPGIVDLKHFMDRAFVTAVFSFGKESPFYGQPLKNIHFPRPAVLIGYEKVSGFQPYDPEAIVNEFVYLYVGCQTVDLAAIHEAMYGAKRLVRSAAIYGAGIKSGDTAGRLATAIKAKGVEQVHIILDHHADAVRLSHEYDFPVLLGDSTQPMFLKKHNLASVDLFVALSNVFEKNLFAAADACMEGVPYTVSVVRHPEHVNFCSTMPVTYFLNPALVNANHILRFHKGEQVVARAVLRYEQAECLEMVVTAKSGLANRALGTLDAVISRVLAIKRGIEFIELSPDTTILPGDVVLMMVAEQEKKEVGKLL